MSKHEGPQGDQLSSASAARRIEAMALAARNSSCIDQHLIEGARQLLCTRHQMDRLLPAKDLQRHAVWSVLLELYVDSIEGGISHVKQIMIATGEKPGTAIRTIDRLEEVGVICREPDSVDGRRIVVRLTEAGKAVVVSLLRAVFEPDVRSAGSPIGFSPRC